MSQRGGRTHAVTLEPLPLASCLLAMPHLGQKPCLCSWPAGAPDTQCPGTPPGGVSCSLWWRKTTNARTPKHKAGEGPAMVKIVSLWGSLPRVLPSIVPSHVFRVSGTEPRVGCCVVSAVELWGESGEAYPAESPAQMAKRPSLLFFCSFLFQSLFLYKRAQLYCTLTAARVPAFPVFSFVCWDPNLSNMFCDLSGMRVGDGWINTFRKCWVASWGTFNMLVYVAITGDLDLPGDIRQLGRVGL